MKHYEKDFNPNGKFWNLQNIIKPACLKIINHLGGEISFCS